MPQRRASGTRSNAPSEPPYARYSPIAHHYWSGNPAGSISECPIAPDPWTGEYDAVWTSDASGNASPYNVNPGLKVGAIPFTIGTDDSECGVTGHTVIVHKGGIGECPGPDCPGNRVGCCVLA